MSTRCILTNFQKKIWYLNFTDIKSSRKMHFLHWLLIPMCSHTTCSKNHCDLMESNLCLLNPNRLPNVVIETPVLSYVKTGPDFFPNCRRGQKKKMPKKFSKIFQTGKSCLFLALGGTKVGLGGLGGCPPVLTYVSYF